MLMEEGGGAEGEEVGGCFNHLYITEGVSAAAHSTCT